ncbi:MAG TPA: spore germination protein GerPC [Bacilli bacterium]|nr:spore germination protein GerPC [Bacilli bacterium]
MMNRHPHEQQQMHELMRENYYLRQRLLELERENQRINLLLAAKTLVINKIEFKFDKVDIENLDGVVQIGLTHQADSLNSPTQLPKLKDCHSDKKGPTMGI